MISAKIQFFISELNHVTVSQNKLDKSIASATRDKIDDESVTISQENHNPDKNLLQIKINWISY